MLCPLPWFPTLQHEKSEQACCEMMTDLFYRQPCVTFIDPNKVVIKLLYTDQCLMETWNITHVSCDITVVYNLHLHSWHLADAFVQSDLQ